MPHPTMPSFASSSAPLPSGRMTADCLTPGALGGGSDGCRFVIGRSLVVCTVLAAAFAGLVASGIGHLDAVTPAHAATPLVETIVKAARVTDIDPALLMAIADKESSFSTHVQARTSSATGLFQFIERTWLQVVRDFGAKHGLAKEAAAVQWVDDELVVADSGERARILELRRNPYLSALLAAEMLSRDRTRIASRIGRDLTRGETYLSHFLGPDDAERFMEKVVDQPNAAAAAGSPRCTASSRR